MVFKAHEKNIQGWEGGVKTIQPREGALSLTFALKSNGNDFFKRKGGRKGRVGIFFFIYLLFQIKFIEHRLPVRVKVRFSLKMKRRIQCS